MKIPLFIIAFLTLVPLFAETNTIIKGSVYSASSEYDVIERMTSKVNGSLFDKGMQLHLTKEWGIYTSKEKGRAHLLFSNRMQVWLGGKTTLWIDNFEQYIDKDENGKTIPNNDAFSGNFRVNGSIDVKLEEISDSGYFNIATNGASLDIKSKRFYVETYKNNTTIECYEGEISLTNSVTNKEIVVKAGETALIYGRDGEMNLSIEVSKLNEEKIAASVRRAYDSTEVNWSLVKAQ